MLNRWQSTIVDDRGNVQPLANLTVRNEADQSLAKMWASPGKSQPLPDGMVQADGNGYAYFYAEGGLYRITSVALGIDWRHVDIGAAVATMIAQQALDTHNHDANSHPELRTRIVSEVSAHVTDEADRAEAASDAAFVNADVYPDVSTGRAAVANGEQFQVLSDDGMEYIRYRKDSASAQTEVARYPSAQMVVDKADYLAKGVMVSEQSPNLLPAELVNSEVLPTVTGAGIHAEIVNVQGLNAIRGYSDPGTSTVGLRWEAPANGFKSGLISAQITIQHANAGTGGGISLRQRGSSGAVIDSTAFVGAPSVREINDETFQISGVGLLPGAVTVEIYVVFSDSVSPGNREFIAQFPMLADGGVSSFRHAAPEVEEVIELAPAVYRLESSRSLPISNPNLFTDGQVSATDTSDMPPSGTTLDSVDGIPYWRGEVELGRWGPFQRSSIIGDTVSAAVNIARIDAPGSWSVRVMLGQYSDSSMSISSEVSRENVLVASEDFDSGFVRIENVSIHPECVVLALFVGSNSSTQGVVWYRDMLFCAGDDATFRMPSRTGTLGAAREVWVSPSGSDGGSGSSSLPFATLTRAAAALGGTGTIYLSAGDYGNQQLSVHDAKELRIVGGADSSFGRSLFRYGNKLALTPVSGSGGVFSAPLINDVSWLWVDGIADEQTLVPYSEQHSLLNGRAHRLESTKVWHIPAANLTDALDLIEMSATPVCWRDTSNNTVYLSLPDGADVSSDVYAAYDDFGFFAGNRGVWAPEGHIELVGLDIRYGYMDVKNFRTSSLTDIRVVGAGNNGFRVGNWSELNLCSAGGSGSGGSLGDGFNAHDHAIWTYKDCYGHDNWDDGESSHQNCKVTGWGNIMEYNGGSGFTPATGAQEVLHNCLSRKNASAAFRTGSKTGGFQVAGDPTPTDPGVITSLEAYNCVSIGDRNGFHDGTGSSSAPAQRRLLAVGCKVFDAEMTAFACAEIRDCSQVGSATPKSDGTLVVNSALVD